LGFASSAATGAKSRDFGVLDPEQNQLHAPSETQHWPADKEKEEREDD
jgi:hypothetical protein